MKVILLRAWMILFIGCLATIFMDAFSILLFYVSGVEVEWSDLGALFASLIQGHLTLSSHLDASSVPLANLYGWIIHYATGIAYAGLYFEIFHKFLKKPIFCIHVFYFPMLLSIIPFCVIAPLEGFNPFYIGSSNIMFHISYTLIAHLFYTFGLILATFIVDYWNKTRSLKL